MKESTRIITNILASYGQSVIGLFLTLFSARWLLLALGHSDYGLFGVVGSTILLMTILTGGLSFGISRFYAFSIGEGNKRTAEELNDDLMRWFNAALSIHILLPIVIAIIGTPLGEYAIRNWLTIPEGRLIASIWVFRISMVAALVNVFGVPFVSMLNAHQRIYVVSMVGVVRSVFTFVIAWGMLHTDGDRLIAYAVCMAGTGIILQLILMLTAYRSFPSCRIRLRYLYERERIQKLFNFTGWKMFGLSCVALRQQGTPVVINLYFGPVVNAAYMVASSLSNQANALSTALTRAFLPAVVTAEGSGDRKKMLSMAMRVCKFGALLVMLFAVPAILEIKNLLQLWLVDPPQYTAGICQWMLVMLIVDRATVGHALAVNAYGKIAAYEIIQGTILFSAVPLVAFLFSFGFRPIAVGIVLFTTMSVCCMGRVAFAKKLVGFPFFYWFIQVAIPVVILFTLGSVVGVSILYFFNESLYRILFTVLTTSGTLILGAWILLFNDEERVWVKTTALKAQEKYFSGGYRFWLR